MLVSRCSVALEACSNLHSNCIRQCCIHLRAQHPDHLSSVLTRLHPLHVGLACMLAASRDSACILLPLIAPCRMLNSSTSPAPSSVYSAYRM
jgi:hypothetical protein